MTGASRSPDAAQRALRAGPFAALVLLCALIAGYGALKPEHSWDTIPYVALVLSLDGVPDSQLHSETYRRLEASMPAWQYQALESGTIRRELIASSPDALAAVLPFWAIKPLYVWVTYALYKAGVDVVHATALVSTISATALAFILGLWGLRQVGGYRGVALAAAIALAGGLPHLAGLARPDGLSALLAFASVLSLAGDRRAALPCVLAVTAVLVRPDNILLASVVCTCVAALGAGERRRAMRLTGASALAGAIALYWVVQAGAGGYGWTTTFLFSFVEPSSLSMLFEEAHIAPEVYLKTLYWSVLESRDSVALWLFLGWNSFAVVMASTGLRAGTPAGRILLLLALVNFAHWLVYPSFDVRFFGAAYLAIGSLLLMPVATTRARKDRQRPPEGRSESLRHHSRT